MNISIAIKSSHKSAERRQACLETWIPEIDFADWFFLIGAPEHSIMDALYCPVSDTFEDLLFKIPYACRYALAANVDYLFVCDDDTYVRPDRLLKSGFEGHDYIGHLRTDCLGYNGGVPYAQGHGYWLSARAMEHVVTAKIERRSGDIEDGSVGRALIGKVPFTHDWRYVPGPACDRIPAPDNHWITTHKALPEVMRRIHKPFARHQ